MPWYNPISITVVWSGGIAAKRSLQNRAARILTSSSYDADAGYLLQQLGWKDLIAQRQIQVALMVFKALNDLAPDYLYVYWAQYVRLCLQGLHKQSREHLVNVPLPRGQLPKKEV